MKPYQIIAELMARYDESRKAWIEKHGTEDGFNEWFTAQVLGD
jgi:hypothetical protein